MSFPSPAPSLATGHQPNAYLLQLIANFRAVNWSISSWLVSRLPNAKILNPRLMHLGPDEAILREWSGLDHLPIDAENDNLLFPTVDYLHWNSVQLDAHGGLLLSFRNRSQIIRLRPEDWSIHWNHRSICSSSSDTMAL